MSNNLSYSLAAFSSAVMLLPQVSFAQEFSFGASVENGSIDLSLDGIGDLEGDLQLLKLTGAAIYPTGGGYFAGGDLSLGFALTGDEFTPDDFGDDSLDQVLRARVLGGYTTGQIDVYAAVGYAVARGDFFPGSPWEAESFDGLTSAIGASYMVADGWSIGIEVLRDDLESDGNKTTTWESTSLDLRASFQF